ncbi:MAG: heme ABC transporter ATP-binding protein [Acidovorax sp.]
MSALVCESVGVAVPGGPLLATVSATLRAGRVAAIVGPNGAGKSTLLSLLSGERAPPSGRVLLQGRALSAYRAAELARIRAVMPQDGGVAFDFTVREVVEIGRYPHRHAPSAHEAAIVERAMEATGVAHLARRGIQTLSGGERARAHLARALAQVWEPGAAPRWLLLDEPTAALDLAHQHQALRLLRAWAVEQGVGVVAVLHDLNLVLRYADDALLLAHGQAQAGPVQEVLDEAAIARVWGVGCTCVRGADGVRQYLFSGQA